LGERLVYTQEVAGSSPAPPTTRKLRVGRGSILGGQMLSVVVSRLVSMRRALLT
jgi:hypothetical protein